MTKQDRLIQINDILTEAYQEGKRDGIAEGLAVAERIMLWYSTNHQLKEPRTPEILEQWSRNELKGLKK